MESYSEKVGKQLNEILEKNIDAHKGYQKAAENVENPALQNFFNRKAAERSTFSQELKNEIRSFGQEVDDDGSFTGSAHRAWMDVKGFLSLDNEESMLEEAIRGEKAAVEEYNEILDEASLPGTTKSLLTNQRSSISNDLNKIKSLEDLH